MCTFQPTSSESVDEHAPADARVRALYGHVVGYCSMMDGTPPGPEGIEVKVLLRAIFDGLGDAVPGIPAGPVEWRAVRSTNLASSLSHTLAHTYFL